MADIFSPQKRSEIMSLIKSKNTKPEIFVRSLLHKMGYRFRLHNKTLPGNPDISLKKYKTVIFVHGCYWHRHKCRKGRCQPSSNIKMWKRKFNNTVKRDRKNQSQLKALGWNVIIIWECELSDSKLLIQNLKRTIKRSF